MSGTETEMGNEAEQVSVQDVEEGLEKGLAAFKASKWEEAIESLGLTLQSRIEAVGGEADECADLYYHYGAALFYRAQEESDVFGAPIDASVAQVPGPSNGVGPSSGAGPSNGAGPSTAAASSAGADLSNEADPSSSGAAQQNGAEDAAEGNYGSESEGDGEGEEEADDDMQLAWENLEVAKTLYERDAETNRDRLTEIHTILADIAMEQENFESAADDYRQAKTLVEAASSQAADRRLAEICYKIGLALQFLQKPEEALKEIETAVQICEKSVQALDQAEQSEQAKEEKASLQSVLEDLKAKQEELSQAITEMQEQKRMIQATFQRAFGAVGGSTGAQAAGTGAAGASRVVDLGTVGQGRRRINLAPVQNSASQVSSGPTNASKPKRTLEDMMGGPPPSAAQQPLSTGNNNIAGPAAAKKQCIEPLTKKQAPEQLPSGKENVAQESSPLTSPPSAQEAETKKLT